MHVKPDPFTERHFIVTIFMPTGTPKLDMAPKA